jgi:hypothetical protein
MPAQQILTRFVEDALTAGRSRDDIAAALAEAGWSEREIMAALSTYADLPFTPPVPRPSHVVAPRHVFLYAVLFIAMGVTAVNMVTLLQGLIDLWLTDLAFQTLAGWTADGLRWAIAALVVAAPVFIALSRHVSRRASTEDDLLKSPLRKWLIYTALLISALVFLGDGIVTLERFLRGELTLRFVLKALVVAAVSGAVFLHYLREAERTVPGSDRYLMGVSVAVGLTVALTFFVIGGPRAAREERLDLARYDDLVSIATALECNMPGVPPGGALPAALTVDDLMAACPGVTVWSDNLTDDETGEAYLYNRIEDTRFHAAHISATPQWSPQCAVTPMTGSILKPAASRQPASPGHQPRRRRDGAQPKSAQPVLDHRADCAEIHPTGVFRLQRRHHAAHVAQPLGAGVGNRLRHRGLDLGPGQLARQEFLDHADFRALLLGQFQPTTFLVGARAFLALLDHLAQDRQHAGIVDTIGAALATQGNVLVLDRGIDQPERAQPRRVLFPHRGLEPGADAFPQIHAHAIP